jgi:DNA mismatch repair protein MutS
MAKSVTPIRKQYLDIKAKYPDAILFFRLGDFYETFDKDAEIAARELDIVLTSRNVAKGDRVPMAGIPHHAAESYIAKLIDRGFHVAICEQIGDGPVKGLFPREVVRVITPGTVLEPEYLQDDSNNYLLSIWSGEEGLGLAFADISTGEFSAAAFVAEEALNILQHEIARLNPAEILHPESMTISTYWSGHSTAIPDWRFECDRAEATILRYFGVKTLDGFGLGDAPPATRAAGVLLEYINESQAESLPTLANLSMYSLEDFMVLDAATRRNLEITRTLRTGEVAGSLLGVLDRTVTPMGKRLIRQWINRPLLDMQRIERRLDQVESFVEYGLWRVEVREALKGLGDLERLINRIIVGMARPHDLVAVRETLKRMPDILALLKRENTKAFNKLLGTMDPCTQVKNLLEKGLSDEPPATLAHTGVIRSGYADELDDLVESSRHAREWIANLESVERERTGIKTLKVGYNKVFGYYIEVTKANTKHVPEDFIRKQTLVNAERYITPEMKQYESLVLTAEEQIRAVEARLFHEISQGVADQSAKILQLAASIGRFDVVSTLAEVAVKNDYVRPHLLEDETLEIREGRHPVVEIWLEGVRYVPNDACFESGEHIRILTGPNMSGKSTYLRQVALIFLMAQMGSFVPATTARLGIADRIFTRIGAQDEIHAGQSTFMVEMVETANILNNATDRSLLILDEVGRGTSTYDGVSIAWAVVEYIHNHPRLRARTLFATHYHELTHMVETLPGIRNYNVAVAEEGGEVVFLHHIAPGGADKSYGIHVAEIAGLPRSVINRAQEILANFEASADSPSGEASIPFHQMTFLTDSHPLLEELEALDLNGLNPLEALNRLYEWQKRYL